MKHPEGRAEVVKEFLDQVRSVVPGLPEDNVTLVKANAAVQVGASVLFALGFGTRLTAWILAATLMPTTYAAHAYWRIEDPKLRSMQKTHFNKNLGILGGLLLAALESKKRTE